MCKCALALLKCSFNPWKYSIIFFFLTLSNKLYFNWRSYEMSRIKINVNKELLWNKETACEDHLKATNSLAKMRSRGLRVAFSETARQTTEWNCISGKQNWKPKFRRVRPQIPEAAAFSSHCWLLQQLTASYQQLQWQHGNLIRGHKLEAEELLCGNSSVKLAVLLSGHASSWWKLRLWSLMQDNGNY